MHFATLGLCALASAAAVDAFKDTTSTPSRQIESAASLLDDVSNQLVTCPTDAYIIVSQPGVHAHDFNAAESTQWLRRQVLRQDDNIKSSFAVSEMVGAFDTPSLTTMLEEKCGAEVVSTDGAQSVSHAKSPQIVKVDFPSLPTGSSRSQQLSKNGLFNRHSYNLRIPQLTRTPQVEFLSSIINQLPSPKYTVIYSTTPRDFPAGVAGDSTAYEMESEDVYQSPLNMNIKRDNFLHSRQDGEKPDNRPLFEKYQFLSPGIFMGLVATLLFTLILYVGFSGLASLKVSYAAFEKDNSPTAMKKQQ
ncbi:hypothetical protein FQN55_008656 [Onygenales sp. PD_40]|nr:hypothetical protein FQN55_008656 [Onygenales sp. PD_40]